MTAFSVVVMEPGSDWPGQVGDSTTLVALCDEGEELLRRTRARLRAFADRDQCVRVAVLACNGETEGLAASRRARIAQVLLDVVARTTYGRLIVSAHGAAPHHLREHLFALVGALTSTLQGSTATVSLRFEGVSPGKAPGPDPTLVPCPGCVGHEGEPTGHTLVRLPSGTCVRQRCKSCLGLRQLDREGVARQQARAVRR